MSRQTPELLNRLEQWFASQCDDDWEHGGAIVIRSLDNPGWAVDIELGALPQPAANPNFTPMKREGDHNWLHAWVEADTFHLRCGPGQLAEGLTLFLETFAPSETSISSMTYPDPQKVAG